jgi:hypothetical protein
MPIPVVSPFATSHADTFQEPETWEVRRERGRRPELVKRDTPRFREIIQRVGIVAEYYGPH